MKGTSSPNRLCLLVVALLAMTSMYPANAQLVDINASITSVGDASVGWADYDLDGDPDLLIAGHTGSGPLTTLYQNNNGSFSAVQNLPFIHVSLGEVAWGDYDADGDPDMVLTGEMANGVATTQMYRNNGNGTFTDVNAGILALEESMVAWGDYDGDGDLDFFIAGAGRNGVSTTRIYQNIGNDDFVNIGANLVGLRRGDGQWVDYDNDGDLDLMLTGRETNNTRRTLLYQNNGGSFLSVPTGLPGVDLSGIDLADTNGNGYKELLISGTTDSGVITRTYRNPLEADGTFELLKDLDGVEFADVAWVDYSLDAELEASVMGRTAQNVTNFRVFRLFGNEFEVDVEGLFKGQLDWADFDGDGDPDLAIAGFTAGDQPVAKIYRNESEIDDEAPITPFNLHAARSGVDVQLNWVNTYDSDGSFSGITYNVRVGTTPGGIDVLAPTISGPGNAGEALSFTLTGLEARTYYWSVQAVDSHFNRSGYSGEQAFALDPFNDDAWVNTRPNLRANADRVVWGDLDNDGDLDAVLAGIRGDSGQKYARVQENVNGDFVERVTPIPDVVSGNALLADYDNDNDLDIFFQGTLVAEDGPVDGEYTADIYRNDGNFNFTRIDQEFPLGAGSCGSQTRTWFDADNNGFIDVVFAGLDLVKGDNFVRDAVVWSNDGGVFSDFEDWGSGSVTCGDHVPGEYNGDGKIDMFFAGIENVAFKSASVGILTNSGTDFSRLQGADFEGFSGRPTWGDYNNDGYLDVVTSGWRFGVAPFELVSTFLTGVYQNNNGSFSLASSILPKGAGNPAFGDYDADGDLDLLIPGLPGSPLWENRDGQFVNIVDAFDEFEPVEFEEAAWGDYDGDGDLDVLMSGWQSDVPVVYVFRNDQAAKNDAPEAPTTLSSSVDGSSVTFNWNRGSDEETPAPGLSYNLRVGTSPGGSDVMSAASLSDGTPLAPRIGHTYHNTSWTLNGLAEGTYYWSVQSIDPGFGGSAFSAEQTVVVGEIDPPDPVDVLFLSSGIGLLPLNEASAEWADYDNDGDPDLMVNGSAIGSGANTILYRNENGQVLVDAGGPFKDVDTGDVAWADYDGDGDLDVLISGRANDWSFNTLLYKNTGSGFQQVSTNLPGLFEGSIAWGDYDNDGDPDLLLAGMNSSIQNTAGVYRNDNGTFADINAGLTGIRRGEIAWVDYDVDGDLDILLTGRIDNVINRRTLLYRNDGGTFTEVYDGLPDVDLSSVDFADYDGDGDPDLLLTGTTGAQFVGGIYRNDEGSFTPAPNVNFIDVQFGTGRWGDYDGDGDPDVVTSGDLGSTRLTVVYRNDYGGDFFTTIQNKVNDPRLRGVSKSATEWSDFNGDGYLDLYVTGETSSNSRQAWLYLATEITSGEAASSSAYADHEPTFISEIPSETALLPNYPNPFNPVTTIRYTLTEPSDVLLAVYDMTGKQVAVLTEAYREAGTHEVSFDGSGLASGMYLTRMEMSGRVFVNRMVLLK